MGDLDELALAARSREVPPGVRACANCGVVLTAPEQARAWNGYLVCVPCFGQFSGPQQVVAGRVDVPPQPYAPPPSPYYAPAPPQQTNVYVVQHVQAPPAPVYRPPPPAKSRTVLKAGAVLLLASMPFLCIEPIFGSVLAACGVVTLLMGIVIEL